MPTLSLIWKLPVSYRVSEVQFHSGVIKYLQYIHLRLPLYSVRDCCFNSHEFVQKNGDFKECMKCVYDNAIHD